MVSHHTERRRRAFTLVEMLVVIAIIALLLAALLPAFSSVRQNAKIAATKANFTALDTGIASYRAEQALGGGPPPSSSDKKESPQQEIANPAGTSDSAKVRVAGAHLLVMAMIGADGLGTPGFKDLNNNGMWWDNTHKGEQGGIYYIDQAGKEKYPRYGGAGYVDEKMRERARSLKELADRGKLLNPDPADPLFRGEAPLPVFLDAWDGPILYYKATPASNRMVSDMTASPAAIGIYRQEDNGVITGIEGDSDAEGYDFGAGMIDNYYHAIARPKSPEATETVENILTDDANWANTFARYILDPKIKARPTPVLKDSYLLISAGPDGRYGTPDDVTNWERETN